MYRVLYLVLVLLPACGIAPNNPSEVPVLPTQPEPVSTPVVEPVVDSVVTNPTNASGVPVADVVSVAVTGDAGNYTFAVTLSSADTGCEQYADWWEVVDITTGKLVYRRILAHSHTSEQPFTRSGGPVNIDLGQPVVIRGHMGGLQSNYGGQVLGGSVDTGFQPVSDSTQSLETVEPLPTGCAF
ncbi:MAG: hypothetical protein F6K11_11225 [Leptolyngbya sp. SIO3F4]|nr:hypothetical protein [Leptolyngbya sp. SIO3F4]